MRPVQAEYTSESSRGRLPASRFSLATRPSSLKQLVGWALRNCHFGFEKLPDRWKGPWPPQHHGYYIYCQYMHSYPKQVPVCIHELSCKGAEHLLPRTQGRMTDSDFKFEFLEQRRPMFEVVGPWDHVFI